MGTNYEKIDNSIQELKAELQQIALSQRELATNYTHIAEMANAHRNAIYGSNGDVGLLAEMDEVQKLANGHEIQLNGEPGKEEGSIKYVLTDLKNKAGTAGKIFMVAATSIIISLIGLAFDFISKR